MPDIRPDSLPPPQDSPLIKGGDLMRGMVAAGFTDFTDYAALRVIGESWGGEQFREKLRRAITKEDGFKVDYNDIARGVKCLAPPIVNAIGRIMGRPVELSTIASLSKSTIGDQVLLNLQIADDDFNAKKQITEAISAIEQGRAVPFNPAATEGDQPPAKVVREFKEHHVYGGSGALCFSATLATDEKTATIRLEGARSLSGREYDWKNKLAIQLSQTELVDLLALMQGWTNRVNIKAHGAMNDKNAALERQCKNGVPNFYVAMNQGAKVSVAVPVPFQYAALISNLVLKQLQSNDPHMSIEMLYRTAHAAYHLPVDSPRGKRD